MGDKTKIEWTDATWSPVTGCSKVSPGCDHCYAETMSRRLSHSPKYALATKDDGTWSGLLSYHPGQLDQPLRWKRPKHIFVCSMSDLFHDKVPWEVIAKVFNVMAATPWHTYQVLTKRPGRMAHFAERIWPELGGDWEPLKLRAADDVWPNRVPGETWPGTAWPSNIWAGSSVETQKYAPRLDCLVRVPAKVRFVSVEPMLGPVDLEPWLTPCWLGADPRQTETDEPQRLIDWVVCGGESGPGARPMDLNWARQLLVQCKAAGVPFFMKQIGRRPLWDGKSSAPADHVYLERLDAGGWQLDLLRDPKGGDPSEWPEDLRVREIPHD